MKCERCGKDSKRLLSTFAVLLDADRTGEALVCFECSKAVDDTTAGASARLLEAFRRLGDALVDAIRGKR